MGRSSSGKLDGAVGAKNKFASLRGFRGRVVADSQKSGSPGEATRAYKAAQKRFSRGRIGGAGKWRKGAKSARRDYPVLGHLFRTLFRPSTFVKWALLPVPARLSRFLRQYNIARTSVEFFGYHCGAELAGEPRRSSFSFDLRFGGNDKFVDLHFKWDFIQDIFCHELIMQLDLTSPAKL